MEIILYEFSFDSAKAIGFFVILFIGAAFFFADKILGHSIGQSVDFNRKEISPKAFKIVTKTIGIGCAILFLLFFGSHMAEYHEYKTRLASNDVSVVEGYVENYHALPSDGKGTENFEIGDVYFAYGGATDGTNGYTITAKQDGIVTHNGQYFKIKYITNEFGENIILYISEFR